MDDPSASTGSACLRADLTTPIGTVTIVASPAGIREILLPDDGRPPAASTGSTSADDPRAHHLRNAEAQLQEYFAGSRTAFDLPLDPVGTEFQRRAWSALSTIPYGATISYAAQAERMGDRRKARAVGGANGRNPISIVVPCHRVIGADGSLTGYGGGLDAKRWLLEHETRTAAGA